MLVVVLLRYALIVKLKIIIGVQIIIGAVLSVSITANGYRLGEVAEYKISLVVQTLKFR
jgi:uncharacterized lipoprotein YajG